jgi:hypothetical protein
VPSTSAVRAHSAIHQLRVSNRLRVGCTAWELWEDMDCALSTVYYSLRRMEEMGEVVRHANPKFTADLFTLK